MPMKRSETFKGTFYMFICMLIKNGFSIIKSALLKIIKILKVFSYKE